MNKIDGKRIINELGLGFKELIFPTTALCPVCHQEESIRGSLGRNCLRKIAFITPPVCRRCGRPMRGAPILGAAIRETECGQCRTTSYYFTKAGAAGLYEGALREYLAELKYRYRPELGAALGVLLVEWLKMNRTFGRADIILPIPIHPQKMEARGYNQAELLAKPLRKYLGIPLKNDIIIRGKITESQSALGKDERFANVKEAFRVADPSAVSGKRILLVDDILTTGATASEASRVLLRAGAMEINVLTLAAGVIDMGWARSMDGAAN